jgi:fibronectin type 3 domain-containing protein
MATVTLSLAPPTTRQDGSAASPADTKSYNIYRASGATPAAKIGVIADPATPQYVDASVASGSYGYSATAVDALGREGTMSDVFPVVVAAAVSALGAPTITKADVT